MLFANIQLFFIIFFIFRSNNLKILPCDCNYHSSYLNSRVNEPGLGHGLEDKKADVDSENAVERVPEDLAGRVCYELEPLVLS